MMNNKTNTPSPPIGSSFQYPVPIGQTVKTKIERGDAYSAPEVYDIEITVLETVRGDTASDRIRTNGITSKPPLENFEYILVRIQFGYSRRGRGIEDSPYQLTEGQFRAVSQDGNIHYELPEITRQPRPQLVGLSFAPGDDHEGWLLFQVPKGDQGALLIFDREYEEGVYGLWGYVWFRI